MNGAGMIWRTLGLGAIAGVRSMAAPAILSRSAVDGRVGPLENTPFAALGSPRVSTALRALEIGELIVDKLPVLPGRTSPPPLLGRAASGALVGAALFASGGRRTVMGGALGAASAMAVAYAAERLRLQIIQRLGVPNVAAGLLEDGIVLFGGSRLMR
jgi:uncharacterized membrane protein